MKTFTIDDIRSWKPCYDPARHLAKDWAGTVLDILLHATIPPGNKLWVVCRKELIDEKTMRLFAVWCARSVPQTDAVCIAAIDTAERHAHGAASDEELSAARSAAGSAAWSATWSAAWYAAGSTARSAARYAAGSVAWSAAESAAESAAWSAQVEQLTKMLLSCEVKT